VRRLDQCDLALQEGAADAGLFRRRVAVAGRAALDGVGDEDLLALEIDGGEHLVQQLAGAPDEGLALSVLVQIRTLADQHQRCMTVADGEDGVGLGSRRGRSGGRRRPRPRGRFTYVILVPAPVDVLRAA
jgi:hypothetical protein